MERYGAEIRSKWKLMVIGASTVVLALIAFSGICWGTLSACGVFGMSWGFWHVFGLAGAALVLLLALRPLGRRWYRAGREAAADAATDAAEPTMPTQRSMPADATEAPGRHDVIDAASRTACDDGNDSWRELYAQLSEEERQEFKALMAKYCGCSAKADPSSAEEPGADKSGAAARRSI